MTPRSLPALPLIARAVTAILSAGLLAIGCAQGGGGGGDGGPVGVTDARVGDGGRRDGSADDAGPRDGGAPDRCGGIVCDAFERCVSGLCTLYSACGGDGACPEGEICQARRCVPLGVDVDGDGSPASEDCDETDPARNPGATETCNMVDDDCDTMVDDGDPAALCASSASGGICISGACGCPAGTFDLDRTVTGCECTGAPAVTDGLTCTTAIDAGTLSDSGQRITVAGNVMPADRVVWYRFVATDTPDATCDNFHVRALLMDNPGGAFEFTVFRGSCDAASCADSGFVDFSMATDFRSTIGGMLTGECPCFAGAPVANVSACTDQSSTFLIRVRRRAGVAPTCAGYTLELSNGIYDT